MNSKGWKCVVIPLHAPIVLIDQLIAGDGFAVLPVTTLRRKPVVGQGGGDEEKKHQNADHGIGV
jgi:hypothetical protein